MMGVLVVTLILAGGIVVGCGDDDDDGGDGAGGGKLTLAYPADGFATTYPFVLAEELGYFEEEDLTVNTEVADGSTGAIQQAISGNVDAGLGASSAYLAAAAAGEDVKALFTTQYRNIFTLAVPADSGVDSLEDLSGATIGVSDLAGGEVPLLRGLLREAGLGGDDYEFVAVGEGAALTVDALESGEVDAYSSNLYDVEAVAIAGIELETILPEVAETFPGNSVVVTAETLEEDRDALVGLLRAVSKAVVFVDENPDAAYEILSEQVPEQFEDEELAQATWDLATGFLQPQPEEIEGELYGTPFLPGLEAYHDFLLEGDVEEGALPGPVDLDTVVDTSLLEEASDFDSGEVEEQARDYTP
jgi:NitT/TauT family transport system substrate-binding protein